jgi:predicted RNA-binding protein YlxR (DUF448 family)
MAIRNDDAGRRCLVTRESQPKGGLIRFVVDPTGQVRPDLTERLPGRGMWLSADRDVVNRAVRRNLFARAARAPVQVDPGLAEAIEGLLAGRVLDDLGLARRAGQAVTGFEKVRGGLRSGTVAVLVGASDGGSDGRRKLRQLAPDLPCITGFPRSALSRALGRENVVHAAVAPGALAHRLLRDVERLSGFRPDALERGLDEAPVLDRDEAQPTTGPR